MKILIEGHSYDQALVKEICGGFENAENGKIKITKVGYYFNPRINDCVICLPKVVMNPNGLTAFENIPPRDLINVFDTDKASLSELQKDFIQSFSLWSYRTISTFAQLNPKSKIVKTAESTNKAPTTDSIQGTILDVIFEIIRFYNANKDYFMYIIKNLHSGYDRINWRKTISSKTPILQEGSPIYIDVINRKKQINFDEELMVIFYSILNYISTRLGITIPVECNYELITGAKFEAYMEGLGETRLRSIKYKYFSDKDLELWRLCYSFFEKSMDIQASDEITDYLLVSSFENVFESMMDALISDHDLPDILKNQEDGKIVDHVFKYKSPIDGKDIYYIGDSKYYAIGSDVGEKSVYKQFTYAKNIIQYHFIKEKQKNLEDVNYRDDFTEGYNFTPNFFISAMIPDSLSYEDTQIRERKSKNKDEEQTRRMSHFPNRLFDRDTLWLTHYDVNLLYIMMLYADNNNADQSSFKRSFQASVHTAFISLLSNHYKFYEVAPKDGNLTGFVDTFFKLLHGKIYQTDNGRLWLALEVAAEHKSSNEELIDRISHHADVKPSILSAIIK